MPKSPITFTPSSPAKGSLNLAPGAAKVAIADICLRKTGDTRPLAPRHVVTLVESIAALGLLEPVVVDTKGNLLAGGHRLAALSLLAISDPEARKANFLVNCGHTTTSIAPKGALVTLAERVANAGGDFTKRYPDSQVPVQVVDVTGQSGAKLALAVETAENTVRREYTRAEVCTLANRFKAAGYKVSKQGGRPKEGEKTVMTALEAALGRSKRQIQRILKGDDISKGKNEWEKAKAALLRAADRVVEAGKRRETDEAKALVKASEMALKAGKGAAT